LLRFFTAAVALFSLVAGLFAMADGIPADVALPAILLAERLPGTLDARARKHVRSVEGASACRYLQRLAALHTYLVQAAAGSDRYSTNVFFLPRSHDHSKSLKRRQSLLFTRQSSGLCVRLMTCNRSSVARS
jgi:hypothetical protein